MAYPNHMSLVEGRIITKLLTKALGLGYLVSVYDGEEWALVKSSTLADIQKEVAATDETTLMFRTSEGEKLGRVWLVHGNEDEVISDCSDNPEINALLNGIE